MLNKNNISTFLLASICFVLPFQINLAAPLIVMLSLWTIIIQFSKSKSQKVKFSKYFLLPLLFLFYLIGLLYTENIADGLKEIEYRLSYIIFPLIFLGLYRREIEIQFLFPLVAFFLGCLLSSFLSISKSITCVHELQASLCVDSSSFLECSKQYSQDFFHCFLTSRIAFKLHTTYLSLYYVIAAFIGFVYLPSTKWKIFSGLYFLVFILLFNSLAIILSLIFMLALLGIYYVLKNKNIGNIKYYLFFGIIGLSFIISVVFKESIFINDSFKSFKSDKEAFYNQHKDNPGSIPARIIFWSVTLDLIKNKPWFGYGTGDAKNALTKEYKNRGLDYIASRQFNPHNQFLQTTLYLGIIVGLAFLIFFILLLIHAVKTENLLFFVFVFQFFFNSLFESMLEGQAGIIFFSLFLFLLFDKSKKQAIVQ